MGNSNQEDDFQLVDSDGNSEGSVGVKNCRQVPIAPSETSGTESRASEDISGMASSVNNTPVTPTGGYRLAGTINGEKVSLLLQQ